MRRTYGALSILTISGSIVDQVADSVWADSLGVKFGEVGVEKVVVGNGA
jgi:hypothetical protein